MIQTKYLSNKQELVVVNIFEWNIVISCAIFLCIPHLSNRVNTSTNFIQMKPPVKKLKQAQVELGKAQFLLFG